MDVQILDKEVSTEFKKTIVDDWDANYQLVPSNVHRRNIAERAIKTFKAHFISVLAGVYPTFPTFVWDNLLVQTELTINLLWQATLNPITSAWEYFNVAFYFMATPLGPICCKLIIDTTKNKRKSWDHRGREGFSVGPVLEHYCCIQAIDSKKNALIVTDTVEYLQAYLTHPQVTAEYRLKHTIQLLSAALKYLPSSICDSQFSEIEAVRTIFTNWRTVKSLPPEWYRVLPHPTPVLPRHVSAPVRYPTPTSKGGQEKNG